MTDREHLFQREVKIDSDFKECDTCRTKPGMPLLCDGCLHNRQLISLLKCNRNQLPTLNINDLKWLAINRALADNKGHMVKTAETLGISRRTLQRTLAKRYQRQRDETSDERK